jgi:hypothetical protein
MQVQASELVRSAVVNGDPDGRIVPAHTKLTTRSGVVGVVASDVPDTAMEGLLAKLLARKAELDRQESHRKKPQSVRR